MLPLYAGGATIGGSATTTGWVFHSLLTKMTLPNVMPSRLRNEPSHPPVNTSANALSRPEAAPSMPGVCQLTFPKLNSHTSQRITSPTRHVISTASPNSVLGSVQITPSSDSSTPPKL